MSHLISPMLSMSEEEKKQHYAKIAQAKAEKRAYVKKVYRTEYLDSERLWHYLADRRGVKLPSKQRLPTPQGILKFARSCGLEDGTWEAAYFGLDYKTSVKKAIEKQQERLGEGNYETLRAMCGYLLEAIS